MLKIEIFKNELGMVLKVARQNHYHLSTAKKTLDLYIQKKFKDLKIIISNKTCFSDAETHF